MEASQHSSQPTRTRLKVRAESPRLKALWHPRILFAAFQFGLRHSFLPCPVRKIFEHDVGQPIDPLVLRDDFPNDMRRTPAAIPNANRDARMSFATKQQ